MAFPLARVPWMEEANLCLSMFSTVDLYEYYILSLSRMRAAKFPHKV